MATNSTHTGINFPASGDYTNTWGDVVNANMSIVERLAGGGRATLTVPSSGMPAGGWNYATTPQTLALNATSVSTGHYPALDVTDAGDLGYDVYLQITPGTAERTLSIRNSLSGSRALIVYQGTYNASYAYTVPNGYDATLVIPGDDGSSAITQVVEKRVFSEVETTTLGSSAQAALINLVYPVGSIYISTVDTSPATLFGTGTWVRFGEGKTLFSQDSAVAALDTAEETGGSATIAEGNLPEHTHDSGSLAGTAASAGGHSHTVTDSYVVTSQSTGGDRGYTGFSNNSTTPRTTSTSGAHTHGVSITSGSTGATGSGSDYYPPYIVVYMWKRTA